MVPVVLLLYSLGHVDLGINSSGAMNHRYLWMFLFSSFVSASQDLKYALKGQEINFKPSINKKPDQIFWLFHDGRGLVLFNDEGEFKFSSYEDRIILDHNTAELTIYNVTYEDSGSYILRWKINNEDYRLKYPVEVIDNVTKPNISCKMVDQNQAFLECLTEGKSDPLLKFKWRSQGTEQTGPILKINLSDEQDVYHCDVSNPLTNETASFLAKDCFLNKIPQDGILISTDMTSLLVTGITGIVSGFILGYIVRRKFQCSELFKIIRAKYFERQKTTEAANPKLLKEKRSFNSEPKQPPISQEKQNLGSGSSKDEMMNES
ncbi:CD48 antigen-like isoform X2 [Syngnathus scovelli]|uniref:CD48 antigen-like isoform X2 n=1 Tax=Syngnathus scovelli TaxID=161590 RepID=UPI00211090CC|nr:CD48 antigen-like isoform X2 [Syngnathus scovelli]